MFKFHRKSDARKKIVIETLKATSNLVDVTVNRLYVFFVLAFFLPRLFKFSLCEHINFKNNFNEQEFHYRK